MTSVLIRRPTPRRECRMLVNIDIRTYVYIGVLRQNEFNSLKPSIAVQTGSSDV